MDTGVAWSAVFETDISAGAAMGSFGVTEMVIILCIVILIFGANRLPEIGRGIGKGIRNFKDATKEGGKEGVEKS